MQQEQQSPQQQQQQQPALPGFTQQQQHPATASNDHGDTSNTPVDLDYCQATLLTGKRTGSACMSKGTVRGSGRCGRPGHGEAAAAAAAAVTALRTKPPPPKRADEVPNPIVEDKPRTDPVGDGLPPDTKPDLPKKKKRPAEDVKLSLTPAANSDLPDNKKLPAKNKKLPAGEDKLSVSSTAKFDLPEREKLPAKSEKPPAGEDKLSFSPTANSDLAKRKRRQAEEDKFSLSRKAISLFPKLDKAGLECLRNIVDGEDNSFTFKFWEQCFPETCQDIVLEEINRSIGPCAEIVNPSEDGEDRRDGAKGLKGENASRGRRQQNPKGLKSKKTEVNRFVSSCTDSDNTSEDGEGRHDGVKGLKSKNASEGKEDRHNPNKLKSKKSEVPWVTQADGGEKVRGFGRKHLYGALGILITAGITQKRQITDHWGTGPFDDFPMVRNCMPRDVFLLFYSRLFHVVSELERAEEDDPEDESENHIRKLSDAFVLAWSSIAVPGRWTPFDEKRVKNTARRAMLYLMSFEKSGPAEHGGVKRKGSFCPRGWCYVQATNNSYRLFAKWAKVLHTQCKKELKGRGRQSGVGGVASSIKKHS